MAYNPYMYAYGQQGYQPPLYQPQQQMQPQPQQQPVDLIFSVSGRKGAEAFPMGPNSRVVLFDDSEDVMYRVTTDSAAYKTIKEFDFSPRDEQGGGDAASERIDELSDKVDKLAESVAAVLGTVEAIGAKPAPRTRKAATDGQ